MMEKLFLVKDKLKSIYSKFDIWIRHGLTFLLAFLSFFVIGKEIGYNSMLSSPFVCIGAAIVCALFPINVTVVLAAVFILIHLFSLSLELAIIAVLVMLIVYLLYFRLAPKTGVFVILTPLLFCLNVPYVIPIVAALTVGITGIIPTICGVFIYYLVSFAANYSTVITTLDADNALANIKFIFNNIITNKEMIVVMMAFALTIVIVYVIKRLSIKYSWMIAIVAGGVMDALIQIITLAIMDVDFGVFWMIFGHIIAMAIGFVLHFFVFAVDYTSTEYVQFEDDDYYYYVKAIPKISVTGRDVKIKKINSHVETKGFVHTEGVEEDVEENLGNTSVNVLENTQALDIEKINL